ncbi:MULTISPECIES: MFS transporter [unclassified Streptomyces]|uniref:MFS transporter n=1 Tax=unclassified Streptomyces TaxID=2593676 RepID=UPI003651ADBC
MSSGASGPFRALRVRNFRLFALGQVVSVAGTWMMVVAQDWLVLDLTDDSASALATVTALQFTPLLLLTLHGGRLADRHDKRTLLTLTNLVSGALALPLGLLVLSGEARLWHVHVFACGLGVVNALEVPTRMAFVGELVGPGLLPNASALSAAYFNVARVAGPALSGLLITAVGIGWVMLLNAASYLTTIAALRLIRPAELRREARGGDPARIVDGLRHVRRRPDLLVPMALLAAVALFGLNFPLTLPLLAKSVYHADASSFGLLTTVFAAGSLTGAMVATGRRARPSARLVAGSAVVFGVLETGVGRASSYPVAVVVLFLTGGASLYFVQAANHRIQLGSAPEFRGRVLALYTLVLQGSTPLGALLLGRIMEHGGARAGFLAGGLVTLAAGAVALAVGGRGEAREADTRPAVPAGEQRAGP